MKAASRRIDLALAVVQRAALLAALWWALTGGGVQAWLVGAPLVTAGVAASLALQGAEPWRLQPLAALRALAWFGWHSLLAGWTVALRALRPRPDLAPGFITLRPRLRDPAARVLLANALSLMPGTLSVELRGDDLELHLLDCTAPIEPELRALEARIAAMLGLAER